MMEKTFFIACNLLFIALSIHAMESNQELSPLTAIENHITACEKFSFVNEMTQHFTTPFPEITTLPDFNPPDIAIFLVNSTLVALKRYDYPIDKLKVANNTLNPLRPKDYPQDRLQKERAALDFTRSAIQKLDKICRAWHQQYKGPNPYAHDPQIPLANLGSYYVSAVQNMEKSLRVAQLAGHDATYIANSISNHLQTLTLNKRPRSFNDAE
jgi:hypothetical protein